MTDLTTNRRTSDTAPLDASPAQEPVLITGHQVLFGTAATVAAPPAQTRRWAETVVAAVHAWFAEAAKPPRPRYVKRHAYLADALMAREMDRL